MNSSWNDGHTECTDLHYLARIEQCSCSSCGREASVLHQTCFQRYTSQSFPATQCHKELGSARAPNSEHNVPVSLLGDSRYGSVDQEDFPANVSFSGATNLGDVTSPELDQFFNLDPAATSSFGLHWRSLQTNPLTATSVDLDMDIYQSTETIDDSFAEVIEDPVYTASVSSSIVPRMRPIEPTQKDLRVTNDTDAISRFDATIDSYSWTMSPFNLFPLVDNSQSAFAAFSPELSRSFNEATRPQLGPIKHHVFFDNRKNEHATNCSTSCPEDLEASNLIEPLCKIDAESSISLCFATGDPDANTVTILDNHSTTDPRLTSFADATSLLTTSAMPGQHKPASVTANMAIDAVRVSKVGEDSQVQALKCPFPGCGSKMLFTRPCDLNKHYRQHFKRFFCRIEGCHMSEQAALDGRNRGLSVGFALKKDRARHETSHDPSIRCEVCGKVFSRADNMQSHMQRIHRRYFSS